MLRIRPEGLRNPILGVPDESMTRVEGLFVGPDGFEGWDDGGGESRRESVERPGAHGEFDLPVFLGSRVVTIDGHALAWSEAELGHLRSQIMGLGATGARFKVTVDHQGQTLWAWARRGSKPTFKDAGIRYGMHRARFMVQFVCADPRKYGYTLSYPGGAAAFNLGNFPALPRIEVTGNMPSGYAIHGPGGKRFVTTAALVPGMVHSINMAEGWLRILGVVQATKVPRAEVWAIPAGGQAVQTLVPVSGSGQMKVFVTDTFV